MDALAPVSDSSHYDGRTDNLRFGFVLRSGGIGAE